MIETHDDYRKRMLQGCRQFSFFGIQPVWRPGEKDIEGFCHDEVVRQWHDPRDGDRAEGGMLRVEWMLNAWRTAEGRSRHSPAIEDILRLGREVEPDYNPDGFRHENVYIGDRMGVYPPFISQCVQLLVDRAPAVEPGPAYTGYVNRFMVEAFSEDVQEIKTVDQWYLAYEWIHPFRDGNGRTGKILHNWLNGTLDDPVLVPDYFNSGNP